MTTHLTGTAVVVFAVLAAFLHPSASVAGVALLGYGAACESTDEAQSECDPQSRASIASADVPGSREKVSGKQPAPEAYPWLVAVGMRRAGGDFAMYCAGSVIAPRWVLTAAHCKVRPGDVVTSGRYDLATKAGREILVKEVLTYRSFNPKTQDGDAALLYLAERVSVTPIALNFDRSIEIAPNTELLVAGWSSASYVGPRSNVPREIELYTVSHGGCGSLYSREGRGVSDTMFCAEAQTKGRRILETGELVRDVCVGDGGAGAVRLNPISYTYDLVGIVSWGIGCGDLAFPGVYTSVSAIGPWVQEQIRRE